MPDPNTRTTPRKFRTEAGLVRYFLQCVRELRTPWDFTKAIKEWNYDNGITDVLAFGPDGVLVAFEAKLRDWRRACLQGYRNTTFADFVYVVLPEDVAQRARANEEYFARHGVGLCACTATGIEVLLPAPRSEPLMTWTRDRAHAAFQGVGNESKRRSHGDSQTGVRPPQC